MCKHIKKVKSSQEAILLLNWVKQFFLKRIVKYICRLEACNFIRKETLAQLFSSEFCWISKNTFLQNTSRRPFLKIRDKYTLQTMKYLKARVICRCTVFLQLSYYRKSFWHCIFCLTQANNSLRDKCLTTEFFLVRIFQYSDWIQENTDQKKLGTWTLSTHWLSDVCVSEQLMLYYIFLSGKQTTVSTPIWFTVPLGFQNLCYSFDRSSSNFASNIKQILAN